MGEAEGGVEAMVRGSSSFKADAEGGRTLLLLLLLPFDDAFASDAELEGLSIATTVVVEEIEFENPFLSPLSLWVPFLTLSQSAGRLLPIDMITA